jgi:hypothetical protein
MNIDLLIDSIVRQTTVLIAQLATASGGRAPLAHTANQVFVELIRELKEQGLGNKVIADMFGLTLRTYHNKVRRLGESATFKGRSLWEAVHSFVQEKGTVRRTDVLARFANDDERIVRAVLSDLVDGGIVFRTGRGDHTAFRIADLSELGNDDERQKHDSLAHLLTVTIGRFGPLLDHELGAHVRLPAPSLSGILAALVAEGRIAATVTGRGTEYSCDRFFVPFDEPAGWEAAIFDHYQAMVTAISIKLRRGTLTAALADAVGGSTYTFDVWPGHPLEQEVLGLLRSFRQQGRSLRERVEAFNAAHAPEREKNAEREMRVITYVGQGVLESDTEEGIGEW